MGQRNMGVQSQSPGVTPYLHSNPIFGLTLTLPAKPVKRGRVFPRAKPLPLAGADDTDAGGETRDV